MTQSALAYKQGDTALVCLDTNLIAGAMMVIRSLVAGLNIVVTVPSANPLRQVKDPIDFMAVVPYQLAAILDSEKEKLKSISTVIIGGAALQKEIIRQLKIFQMLAMPPTA